ncbi:hypothetical protein [Actinophytocola sp. NPDC049390]|uniref:hypothetical protein n=1 Tax=Actinophytocola sp. NPDC049390 TaxID=3363894 RepID=UPI0037909977
MTYAGAYGRDERLPVDRLLRREDHPLGVRRSEATKIATEEAAEAASSNKRWTFGAAAGALLVAGTMAAGALGLSGGATPVAGSAPEHAPASPGHHPGGPVVGAPAPGQADDKQQKRNDQTTPSSANGPSAPAPAAPDTGVDQGSSPVGGGGGTPGGTSTPAPAPAPQQPAPQQPAPAPAPAPEQQQEQEQDGGLLTPVTDAVGDVLTPVTDTVGGVLSPLTGSSTTSTQSAPAPSGPALTMIDPLGDLLGG